MRTNFFTLMLRYVWMPGSDIFTRRRVRLEKYWQRDARKVLDAGCGNGWFAYRAYRSGASVTGIALPSELIAQARGFYNDFLHIPTERLHFLSMNLYDLPQLADRFDEIICYETLEHIKDDKRVCASFFAALKPGGVLHLCCPNAAHPRWQAEAVDREEHGGHVRTGYTESDYRQMLEPLGFQIELIEGVGGPLLVYLQERLQHPLRQRLGEVGAAAVTILALPFIWLEPPVAQVPFSLYVRAGRPVASGTQ